MSGLEELDRGYAQNKGWKAPADVLKSYREFEKFKGVPQERLLALPDKEDDAEGWARVHARLGRPEKPEDYALDTGNPEHSAMIAKVMHESGISKAAASKIVQADLDWRKASDEAAVKAFVQKDEEEISSLKKEWAAGFDGKVEQGRRFVRQLGIDAETLGTLTAALGSRKTLELMAKAGEGLGEHDFVDNGSGSTKFGLTPEAAKAKIAELLSNKEWTDKYMAGSKAEGAEYQRLLKYANGIAG